MSEVGALIIKLQAETAQFRSDMGKVKGDLKDLKGEADKSGAGFESMGGHAGGIRTQLGLLDNVVRGAHAQAMADLIRKFSDSKIVMEALPIAATGAAFVLVGALILEAVNKVETWQLALRNAADQQEEFQAKLANIGTGVKEKLLEVGIEADDLAGHHLAAVAKALKLINMQTLGDLENTFKEFAGVADEMFKNLEGHWYQFGDSSDKAKQSFADFKAQYDLALSKGDKTGVNKLLDDQIDKTKQIVALEQQARNNVVATNIGDEKGIALYNQAISRLKEMGISRDYLLRLGDNELKSEQQQLQVLRDYLAASKDIVKTGEVKVDNKKAKEAKSAEEALKKEMEAWKKLGDEIAKNEKEQAAFWAKQKEGVDASNLNRGVESAIEYSKAQEKMIKSGAAVAQSLEKISTAQRMLNQENALAAIEGQIDGWKRLADEGLMTQSQLAAKLKPLYQQETDAKLAAVQDELNKQKTLEISARSSGETAVANNAIAKEIELQNKLAQIRQQGNAKQSQLDHERGAQFQKLMMQEMGYANDAIAKQIMGEHNLKAALASIGQQMLGDFLRYELQKTEVALLGYMKQRIAKVVTDQAGVASHAAAAEENTGITLAENLKQKFSNAKTAFSNDMAHVPWPLNIPVAVADFAMTMAFEQGGKIPGAGAVPILGHGGETVVTKALTDRVEASEGRGGKGKGDTHIHFSPTVQAFDSEGVDRVLATHSAKFQRHITSVIRRMNK